MVSDSLDHELFEVSFKSIHNKVVTGLLSKPKNAAEPLPVVILMHGLGDRVTW